MSGLQQVYDEAMIVWERTDENASHDAMARSVEALDAALRFEVSMVESRLATVKR